MSLQNKVKELAELVPRPPEMELPNGADEFLMDDFTKETGISIPAEFRDWLKFTNGPLIGPGGIFGLETKNGQAQDIAEVLIQIPEFGANKLLPVASDGCGNYYALETLSADLRPVYFFDACDGFETPNYVVASGFWRFLWFLLSHDFAKTGWPFNETYVIQHDPDIINVQTAKLPWDPS